ncbi:MAG: carboxymuconolactone decarboxylase family protein [Candidatus Eremiobacteraeota bacterium]|nr:carboxymuconolactone decarboxylase family protein [Candidatus Eremiobacteraeota bacterium]MBC5828140.1 carboxymuconolactone decarboxylase family protein [Candidatus Eremiobacteraeota bacterium]
MPRLPAIDPKDAASDAKAALDEFHRARGNYPNMFRTLAVRPDIMLSAATHMQAVTAEGTVPRRLKELCILLVSTLNSCEY